LALPSNPRLVAAIIVALLLFAIPAARAEDRGPDWNQLTPSQQQILAPLKDDWANIEGPRRYKWIDIAKRYPSMTAEQQARLQRRMKQWASLSPEERAQVRERYKRLREMPPDQREAIRQKWREYDSLTEEEKDTLRQAFPAAKPPAKP